MFLSFSLVCVRVFCVFLWVFFFLIFFWAFQLCVSWPIDFSFCVWLWMCLFFLFSLCVCLLLIELILFFSFIWFSLCVCVRACCWLSWFYFFFFCIWFCVVVFGMYNAGFKDADLCYLWLNVSFFICTRFVRIFSSILSCFFVPRYLLLLECCFFYICLGCFEEFFSDNWMSLALNV